MKIEFMETFEMINESFLSSLRSKLEDENLTFDQKQANEKILNDEKRFTTEFNILIDRFLKG